MSKWQTDIPRCIIKANLHLARRPGEDGKGGLLAETVTVRSMRLVSPKGVDLDPGEFHLNARFGDLNGKRLGLMENSKDNSDKLLHQLGEILKEKYNFAEVRYYSKHHASLPAKQEVVQNILNGVDVLITGVGD
jgi:hypothetical protein